jgi:hypothetical protein
MIVIEQSLVVPKAAKPQETVRPQGGGSVLKQCRPFVFSKMQKKPARGYCKA